MNTTIRSRDGATFHFTAMVDGGYVWVSINGGNRKQICRGGYTMGETLTAYSAAGLKKTARRWYRAHRRLTH